MRPLYRIYIDEVGNPDLGSSDDPNHRFLSLTGIIANLGEVARSIHPDMERLKSTFFHSHPDEPVILHRKDMFNGCGAFATLKDPIQRSRFDTELIDLVARWDYSVITVCIDKRRHRETYSTWRYDPYHYCLEVIVERYFLFLQTINSLGDIMIESRGGKEDCRLKDSFHRLYCGGTHYISSDDISARFTSNKLKAKAKSCNIAGLQLADLLAHTSRSEILEEVSLLHPNWTTFASRIKSILKEKYVHSRDGRVVGRKLL